MVKAAGREVHRGELGTGHTRIEVGVPEGVTDSVRVEIEAAGRTLLDEAVALAPVAARAFHVIPHSHVDIGYSDPQPEVERKQWANFRDALALFREDEGHAARGALPLGGRGPVGRGELPRAGDGERAPRASPRR